MQFLTSEDELDSEKQLLSNASVFSNGEAEQTEASSSQGKKVNPLHPINVNRVSVSFLNMQRDYCVSQFNSYDDTMVSYNNNNCYCYLRLANNAILRRSRVNLWNQIFSLWQTPLVFTMNLNRKSMVTCSVALKKLSLIRLRLTTISLE